MSIYGYLWNTNCSMFVFGTKGQLISEWLFDNILSDCHYSDLINSLLNAFRLKKRSFEAVEKTGSARLKTGNEKFFLGLKISKKFEYDKRN